MSGDGGNPGLLHLSRLIMKNANMYLENGKYGKLLALPIKYHEPTAQALGFKATGDDAHGEFKQLATEAILKVCAETKLVESTVLFGKPDVCQGEIDTTLFPVVLVNRKIAMAVLGITKLEYNENTVRENVGIPKTARVSVDLTIDKPSGDNPNIDDTYSQKSYSSMPSLAPLSQGDNSETAESEIPTEIDKNDAINAGTNKIETNQSVGCNVNETGRLAGYNKYGGGYGGPDARGRLGRRFVYANHSFLSPKPIQCFPIPLFKRLKISSQFSHET